MTASHTAQILTNLFEQMKSIDPAVGEMERYEFHYALDNLIPPGGWDAVEPMDAGDLERMVNGLDFYEAIRTREKRNGQLIIDERILDLARMLFVGLASGKYPPGWVNRHFYFDVRAFLFFHRTVYFTPEAIHHFNGAPYRRFEARQARFAAFQGVGYKDFREANAEIDQAFINLVLRLVAIRGTPILMTLAGPTAAGKTEITERLTDAFAAAGKRITTIEMDNFLLDRDIRGEKPMGRDTHHFDLFLRSLRDLLGGEVVEAPTYDFVEATSSHNPDGIQKPGRAALRIEPADIIFIEGNFPFQIPDISGLIGLKVVYLTDDPIRFKR